MDYKDPYPDDRLRISTQLSSYFDLVTDTRHAPPYSPSQPSVTDKLLDIVVATSNLLSQRNKLVGIDALPGPPCVTKISDIWSAVFEIDDDLALIDCILIFVIFLLPILYVATR